MGSAIPRARPPLRRRNPIAHNAAPLPATGTSLPCRSRAARFGFRASGDAPRDGDENVSAASARLSPSVKPRKNVASIPRHSKKEQDRARRASAAMGETRHANLEGTRVATGLSPRWGAITARAVRSGMRAQWTVSRPPCDRRHRYNADRSNPCSDSWAELNITGSVARGRAAIEFVEHRRRAGVNRHRPAKHSDCRRAQAQITKIVGNNKKEPVSGMRFAVYTSGSSCAQTHRPHRSDDAPIVRAELLAIKRFEVARKRGAGQPRTEHETVRHTA